MGCFRIVSSTVGELFEREPGHLAGWEPPGGGQDDQLLALSQSGSAASEER